MQHSPLDKASVALHRSGAPPIAGQVGRHRCMCVPTAEARRCQRAAAAAAARLHTPRCSAPFLLLASSLPAPCQANAHDGRLVCRRSTRRGALPRALRPGALAAPPALSRHGHVGPGAHGALHAAARARQWRTPGAGVCHVQRRHAARQPEQARVLQRRGGGQGQGRGRGEVRAENGVASGRRVGAM